jgi:para-aminobenzoate synthetase
MQVVRYHSLLVDETTLPPELVGVAWTGAQGLLMALAHASRPHFGVQFHPESCASAFGAQLLANFGALARAHMSCGGAARPASTWQPPRSAACSLSRLLPGDAPSGTRVRWRRVCGGGAAGGAPLFWGVVAPTAELQTDSWWLDSATADDGRGRFSYMVWALWPAPARRVSSHARPTAGRARRTTVAPRLISPASAGCRRAEQRRAHRTEQFRR